MKITKVEPVTVRVPYVHGGPKPQMGSGEVRETMDALLLRVETDEGVIGWGEAFGFATTPVTTPAIKEAVAPRAVGRDPTDIDGVTTAIKRQLQNMMNGGPARFALSGLEIALWDIRGKIEGKPVWRLLGGPGRERVPAYASLLRLHEPALTAKVAAAAAERGYKRVKLHERNPESVSAARDALGADIALMVDANCAWTPDEALEMARRMRHLELAWLEEPITPPDDYESLAWLRREGGVPIAIGENLGNPNDVKWLAREHAVDIVQPSVVKIGGIGDVRQVISIARNREVRCIPHSPFIGPGLLATLHILAAMEDEVPCEHRFCELEANLMGDAFNAREGYLDVPQGPGLGVDPEHDVIKRYRTD